MSDKTVKLMEELSETVQNKYHDQASELNQRAAKIYECLCKEITKQRVQGTDMCSKEESAEDCVKRWPDVI